MTPREIEAQIERDLIKVGRLLSSTDPKDHERAFNIAPWMRNASAVIQEPNGERRVTTVGEMVKLWTAKGGKR